MDLQYVRWKFSNDSIDFRPIKWDLSAALLSLTVLLLSFAIPEFEMVREALLSAQIFTLVWGSFPEITLDSTPSFWVLAVLGTTTTLIHAILAPIWALLTTHLYIERTGIQQNAISH